MELSLRKTVWSRIVFTDPFFFTVLKEDENAHYSIFMHYFCMFLTCDMCVTGCNLG